MLGLDHAHVVRLVGEGFGEDLDDVFDAHLLGRRGHGGLGHYNPRTKPAIVHVDKERVDYWLGKGAQPSDSVRTLMARHLTVKPEPVPAAVKLPPGA